VNKLLHIIATPRGEQSRTLKIAQAFMEGLEEKYPDCIISSLNLCEKQLPRLDGEKLGGKYTLMMGQELVSDEKARWKDVEEFIERFKSADAYLLTTPMWNFHIPYYLKHYIDIIVQPHYTFRTTDKGTQGLVSNKKMVVVSSRGWDYSANSPLRPMDFQEPYLKAIFGFIGITDIKFVYAQPMDLLGPKVQRERIEAALTEAKKLGQEF